MDRSKVFSRRAATPQTTASAVPQSFPECKTLAEARVKWKEFMQFKDLQQSSVSLRARDSIPRSISNTTSKMPTATIKTKPTFQENSIDVLHMLDNQDYSSIIPEFGLTAQDLLLFQFCGLDPQSVSSLRSLFISLDKDGGGELGPDEVCQAMQSSGQKVGSVDAAIQYRHDTCR